MKHLTANDSVHRTIKLCALRTTPYPRTPIIYVVKYNCMWINNQNNHLNNKEGNWASNRIIPTPSSWNEVRTPRHQFSGWTNLLITSYLISEHELYSTTKLLHDAPATDSSFNPGCHGGNIPTTLSSCFIIWHVFTTTPYSSVTSCFSHLVTHYAH